MDNDKKPGGVGTGTKMPAEELEKEAERSKKLKLVLTRLLSNDFKLSDDTLIEKLFTVLQKQFIERSEKWKASDLGMYVPWLLTVVKKWKTLKTCVKVLSLRLTGLAASLKPGLKTLFECGLFKNISSLVKIDAKDPSVMFAYTECLYSIVQNDITCNYILDYCLWKDMIHIALNSSSIYSIRKGRQCVALLVVNLSKSHSLDKVQCVLDACLVPLRHKQFVIEIPPRVRHSPDDPKIKPFPQTEEIKLLPSLLLAIEILSELLLKRISYDVINNMINCYGIKDWCWNVITEENENIEIINESSRLLAYANATSIVRNENGEVEYKCMRGFSLEALKHLNVLCQKHMFTLILDMCLDYQTLWAKYGGKVTYTEEDLQSETFDMENVIIIVQCMPLYICMKVTRVMESDVMDMFANKVFTLSCKETQRVCYMYRDCLREAPDRSLEALCLHAIRSFLRIPSCYTKREQAVMSFQCMMHTLKEFVPEEVNEISADCIVAKRTENLVSRFPNILSALLDGLCQFITTFKITWQDSLETVCILSFVQTLADKKDISPMLCAKALQLAKHVIAQFIPPNLALLVDTLRGSSMENLGGIIHRKVLDIHWEVRDSALELLQAITNISKAKFPAFQSLLVEKDLPGIVVSLISSDPSSYVRASALLCLSEMVQVQHVWDTCLFDKRLLEQCLRCLLHDTEGIVRKQAALLVNSIYLHQLIPSSQAERLFDVMSHITQKDLDGDTKLACLEFWVSVIEKCKSRQGMMDGEFPPITFSAQKKKIITLDSSEIRSRLGQLLSNLSLDGCLQVLWTSVQDDCDISVSLKGKEIIDKLIHLLDKYDAVGHLTKMNHIHQHYSQSHDQSQEDNVHITLTHVDQPTQSTSQPIQETKVEEVESIEMDDDKTNQIIEEIVLSEDVDLVEKLAHCDVREPVEPSPRSILPPLEFLNRVLSIDGSETDKRIAWIEQTKNGLDSLLDDIMSFNNNTNLIDCY